MRRCGDAVHYLVDESVGCHHCHSVVQFSLWRRVREIYIRCREREKLKFTSPG